LSNATVIFDADGDGLSDLDRNFYTNAFGMAQIVFSKEELDRFDLNKNGLLDSNEGKFVVIGGIDTSTGTKFSGKLIADVNSSVVSPLTTIIAEMMDLGATKEEAVAALALALGIDSSIDFTTYDPIQEAFEGDERATDVMLANLRMANLVNQAEGLLLALSSEYQGYEVGTNLLGEIAKQINAQISEEGIDLEEILIDALPVALASVGTTAELTLEDQLAMFQLMVDLDNTLTEYEHGLEFSEVMQRQREIIHDLDDLFGDLTNDETVLSLRYHQLTITSQVGGTAEEAGLYPYGSKVAIFAQAQNGYAFNGWTGEGVLDANAAATFITMTRDRNITAEFVPKQYQVSVLSTPGGQATGAGTYSYGQIVTLTALPEADGTFLGWYENDKNWTIDASLQVTADRDFSLVARFSSLNPTLVLTSDTGGTAVGGGSFTYGETTHIQALAEPDFVFDGWTSGGAPFASTSSALVVMNENQSLHASFVPRPKNSNTLVLESVPLRGGKTIGSDAYFSGELVTISAEPLPGYTFREWTGATVPNSTSPNTAIVMDADYFLQANFLPIDYELKLEVSGQGEVSGGGIYAFGTSVNLSASPQQGYRFMVWKDSNGDIHIDQNITLIVTENTVIEAHFEPVTYSVTIYTSSGGVAYGAGDYAYNSLVTIEAHPATGFSFAGWIGDGISDLESRYNTIFVTQDTNLQATFSPNDNYFTPRAANFQFWIDHQNYETGDLLYAINGLDEDGDDITYQLVSGNIDADGDSVPLLGLSSNGLISMLDPDEIDLSFGSSLKLIISLSDRGGKASLAEGTANIRSRIVMNSMALGDHWYQSDWFGLFLTSQKGWVYHYKLGWLFVSPLDHQGYWIWDVSLQDWLWTDSEIFPWLFSGSSSSWLYFTLEEEKVRFFDHNLQKWMLRL